jgi:hypothetical protein
MSANKLTLPPISLSELPERTKDYLLALCNQDNIAPAEAMKKTLDLAAMRAGFSPTTPTEGAGAKPAMAA